MEHRHCRSRSHLLSRRQQNLCLHHSGWSTHSYAYAEYDSNSDVNTNSYAVPRHKPYPYTESDTEVAPDSTVAPNSSAATVS